MMAMMMMMMVVVVVAAAVVGENPLVSCGVFKLTFLRLDRNFEH